MIEWVWIQVRKSSSLLTWRSGRKLSTTLMVHCYSQINVLPFSLYLIDFVFLLFYIHISVGPTFLFSISDCHLSVDNKINFRVVTLLSFLQCITTFFKVKLLCAVLCKYHHLLPALQTDRLLFTSWLLSLQLVLQVQLTVILWFITFFNNKHGYGDVIFFMTIIAIIAPVNHT